MSVRMKLEERRKRIEEEKRKMEVVMSRQREKGAGGMDQSAVGNTWLSERAKSTTSSPAADQRPTDQYSPTKHMKCLTRGGGAGWWRRAVVRECNPNWKI